MKKLSFFIATFAILASALPTTTLLAKESVIVCSSAEDFRNAYFARRFKEALPDIDVVIDYYPTGNHAAKLLSEGSRSACDISYDMEFAYLEKLKGNLAALPQYDQSIYTDDFIRKDAKWLPSYRNGGAVILNTQVLRAKGIPEPKSYEDLLKPIYRGLISMPNPKTSGTGYMFLANLAQVMGEKKAFDYFEKLSDNILQFTSSGSGPVKALVQGEAAVGLGMTGHAAIEISKGAPLKITFFKEGSPYTLYGMAVVKGKEKRPAVQKVVRFFYEHLMQENNEKFFPERVFKDKAYRLPNFPEKIQYADMGEDTLARKEHLLSLWDF